jgi:DNA-binding response OmpR family regulator
MIVAHALIIDDNDSVSDAIEQRLARYGFTSFTQVWTEADAMAEARRHRPDLLLVGDSLMEGSAIEAARRISDRYGTPALLVTGHADRVRRSLPEGVSMGGPFLIPEIADAIACAQSERLH